MVEQLESAMSPSDQLAGVDAARGVIPYLRSRLAEDNLVAARVALSVPFGRYVEQDWEAVWKELANEPPNIYAEGSARLIECLRDLQSTISQLPIAENN
jgi:hypothetical protein